MWLNKRHGVAELPMSTIKADRESKLLLYSVFGVYESVLGGFFVDYLWNNVHRMHQFEGADYFALSLFLAGLVPGWFALAGHN